MNVTVPDDLGQQVAAYCARAGCSHPAGVVELLRRGLIEADVADVRRDIQDIRAVLLDLYAAHDAQAPYAIAALALLAYRQAAGAGATLSETEYQEIALDTARLIWDAVLAGRGIPIPDRAPSEVRS
jgi:hypothetical protein